MWTRLACSCVVIAWATALTAPAGAQAINPQVPALNALRSASRGLELSFRRGFPRTARFDVTTTGTTPVARARNFLSTYSGLFQQTSPDQRFELEKVDTIHGLQVVSFGQSYKGVPIFASRISVGMLTPVTGGPTHAVLAGGVLLPDPGLEGGLETFPALPPGPCIVAARAAIGQPAAPVLAEPRLMIYDARIFDGPPGAHLVWAVALGGSQGAQFVCDVGTSAILFSRSFEFDGAGLDDFDLDLEDANNENMKDTNCFNPTTVDDAAGDEDGVYDDYQNDPDAQFEWENIRKTYLFYHDGFGLHSWDDDDAQIELYVHSSFSNARSRSDCGIEFHTGWPSFDITVHEFTHGVIAFSSELEYKGQSGALNESYADSMGAVADPPDWQHGEDRLNGQGANRSLSNPPSKNCTKDGNGNSVACPDRFALFVTNPNPADNGGVHTNSSIINKAHFLMATGEAFNGVGAFPGMGRTKLGQLVYMVMRTLGSTAQFVDARNWSVAMANVFANLPDDFEIFPDFVPSDVCAVRNAYAAVEIGNGDYDCNGVEDGPPDPDGDFIPNNVDNCPGIANPDQKDLDGDGAGDICDQDNDGDGISDNADNCINLANWDQQNNDGDANGDACDGDDDNDGVADAADNCQYDANPSQADGNNDGAGDACDIDSDGDGQYVLDDNCTFVDNPSQTDTDGDGLGDACDLCPTVADWQGTYTSPPFPGDDPKPIQPDSDGDGTPDACDPLAFGPAQLTVGGAPFNARNFPAPSGRTLPAVLTGPVGSLVRVPIPVCDPDGDPDPAVLTELRFTGLDNHVQAAIRDERGVRIAFALPGTPGSPRGLRFHPNCARVHSLEFVFDTGFPGSTSFTLTTRLAPKTVSNPWTTTPGSGRPPAPLADGDRDGVPDSVDTCPLLGDADQFDVDGDRAGDLCDNCRSAVNPRVTDPVSYLAANPWATLTGGQRDDDHDGYGNLCDAKFGAGAIVGPTDLAEFRTSQGKSRALDVCGTSHTRPCASFDLDETSALIGPADLTRFRLLNGKAPGPKCASCPLPCAAGTAGSCF